MLSSMPHLCELLYTFGPPGSGKDADALFLQELLGLSYCGSLPTGDVICLPNQQERGVEGSTPSIAALQGKKAALVPEVPQGVFAWHRLKHYVEQQGVRPAQRANREAPTYERPTFALLLWSNYAPDMGKVAGAARRTAVIRQDARYGGKFSEEDGMYLENKTLKGQIIEGKYRQDMLWTSIAWTKALLMYATSIPKPAEVSRLSMEASPDPLRQWAAEHLEPVSAPRHATTCSLVKKAAAVILRMGERSPQLQVAMRASGFTLDCVCSGGTKRVCRYVFAEGENARFVKLRDAADAQ